MFSSGTPSEPLFTYANYALCLPQGLLVVSFCRMTLMQHVLRVGRPWWCFKINKTIIDTVMQLQLSHTLRLCMYTDALVIMRRRWFLHNRINMYCLRSKEFLLIVCIPIDTFDTHGHSNTVREFNSCRTTWNVSIEKVRNSMAAQQRVWLTLLQQRLIVVSMQYMIPPVLSPIMETLRG
jgi:hypothetical protein